MQTSCYSYSAQRPAFEQLVLLRAEVLSFLNQTATVNQYKMNELQVLSIENINKLAAMIFWEIYRCDTIY